MSNGGKNAKKYTGVGAAYGTAKSGIGIAGVGTYRPDLIMKVHLPSDPLMLFRKLTGGHPTSLLFRSSCPVSLQSTLS